MVEAANQRARRKLSFLSSQSSQQPTFSQFYSHNHSSNYLQLALNNLTQLIKESEQQIIDEQKSIVNDENRKLNRIQNLQNDIHHVQTSIDSLTQEIEKLTFDTYDMLVRQSETALIRHNQILRESIEHINQVLRKRSIVNDSSSLEQLRKDLSQQQEKLFLIRNQMDIDHNKLATNMSILRECQEQRNQLEHIKTKKQVELQNIQHIQGKSLVSFSLMFSSLIVDDIVQKQLHLQKLQISIEQQTRVRNEIQQLGQSIEPRKELRREQSTEPKEELDLLNTRHLESVTEIDEEDIVEANERDSTHPDDGYDYSFSKLTPYREKTNDVDGDINE